MENGSYFLDIANQNFFTMSIFRCLQLCLLVLIYGVAFPSYAATQIITLYLPDNFDAHHKQIPNTQQLTEIFNYFEREADIKFDIVTLPWKRAQLEVRQGNGILYGFSTSAERLEQYRFSLPVITLHVWAITFDPANANFSEVADLKGKTVTGGLGLSHGMEYENAKNKIFTVQEDFISFPERLKKLIARRSDLMLASSRQHLSREQMDNWINHTLIPGFNDPELKDKHFDVSIKPLFYDTIHFASGKAHFDEVINRIDKAIQKGMKDGSLAKLLAKYE